MPASCERTEKAFAWTLYAVTLNTSTAYIGNVGLPATQAITPVYLAVAAASMPAKISTSSGIHDASLSA